MALPQSRKRAREEGLLLLATRIANSVNDGAILENLGIRDLVVDQRRRPHAVAVRRIDLGAQRILPFAGKACAGNAGAAGRFGHLGCFAHSGSRSLGDRALAFGDGANEAAGHGGQGKS